MSEKLTTANNPLLDIARGRILTSDLSRPFARDILLISCYVAGTTFRDDIAQIEPRLQATEVLTLRREPENEHDALAIMVLSKTGAHLGYIPRRKNEALAHLMDAGKMLFAVLREKSWQNEWLRLDIEVYLRDL